jgi:hypothetical protein
VNDGGAWNLQKPDWQRPSEAELQQSLSSWQDSSMGFGARKVGFWVHTKSANAPEYHQRARKSRKLKPL